MFGPTVLEDLPFELLALEHIRRPQEVQDEFVRRLYRIVFQAAHAHLRESGNITPTEQMAGKLAEDIFTQFAPEFASGAAKSILVRLASTIRRKLGDSAFQQVADRYYAQLVVYHIDDGGERRFLAAAYEEGLSGNILQRLAIRFNVSEDRCRSLFIDANHTYAEVIERKFDPNELRDATDGFIVP